MSKRATTPHCIAAGPANAGECVLVNVNRGPESHEIQLDQDSISALIAFFRALDEWDREANLQ